MGDTPVKSPGRAPYLNYVISLFYPEERKCLPDKKTHETVLKIIRREPQGEAVLTYVLDEDLSPERFSGQIGDHGVRSASFYT
jgi:hypothetical protein